MVIDNRRNEVDSCSVASAVSMPSSFCSHHEEQQTQSVYSLLGSYGSVKSITEFDTHVV